MPTSELSRSALTGELIEIYTSLLHVNQGKNKETKEQLEMLVTCQPAWVEVLSLAVSEAKSVLEKKNQKSP